jgi:hypothetical protein
MAGRRQNPAPSIFRPRLTCSRSRDATARTAWQYHTPAGRAGAEGGLAEQAGRFARRRQELVRPFAHPPVAPESHNRHPTPFSCTAICLRDDGAVCISIRAPAHSIAP